MTMLWFLLVIFNFDVGLVLEKRRNFVSSSPKCIDNLLSMNHSQKVENSLVEATLIIIMSV